MRPVFSELIRGDDYPSGQTHFLIHIFATFGTRQRVIFFIFLVIVGIYWL